MTKTGQDLPLVVPAYSEGGVRYRSASSQHSGALGNHAPTSYLSGLVLGVSAYKCASPYS